MYRGEIMNHLKHMYKSIFIAFLSLVGVVQFSTAQQPVNTVFRDDFIGKTLNPKWQTIAPDKERLTLIDNEHLMVVTTKKGVNIMQYSSELPEDYEVILKVQTPPLYVGQVARLLIRRDDENNIRVAYSIAHNEEPDIQFNKSLRGEDSGIPIKTKPLRGEPFYFKLSKHGVEYKGAYSTDGLTWIPLGTHVFLDLRGNPAFEAYNHAQLGRNVPESGIRFDYFEIKSLK
jgi:hypothetical protein